MLVRVLNQMRKRKAVDIFHRTWKEKSDENGRKPCISQVTFPKFSGFLFHKISLSFSQSRLLTRQKHQSKSGGAINCSSSAIRDCLTSASFIHSSMGNTLFLTVEIVLHKNWQIFSEHSKGD